MLKALKGNKEFTIPCQAIAVPIAMAESSMLRTCAIFWKAKGNNIIRDEKLTLIGMCIHIKDMIQEI